jgi:branched-chain amino acid transport system substrate-binding protein
MHLHRRAAGVLFVAVLMVAAAACGSSGSSGSAGASSNSGASSPYRLGFSLTLSGPESSYGFRAQEGATIAIDKINAAGGVNGHPLQAYYVDNQFPNTAVALAGLQKLISLDHVLSVTASGSPLLLAYEPVTSRSNVILMNYAATDPTIANPDKMTYSVIASEPEEANALTRYLKAQGKVGSAALIVDNSDVGQASQSAFEAAWKAAGGTVTTVQTYDVNSLDLSGQVAKVAATHPSYVYFQISTPPEAAEILNAAKQLGFHPQWLSNTFFGATDSAPAAAPEDNGLIYSYVAFQPSTNALASAYASAFQAKYHKAPDIYSATSYVGVELMAAALKQVGPNPAKIASFLDNTSGFPSILGKLSFVHGQLDMPVNVLVVNNGQPQILSGGS